MITSKNIKLAQTEEGCRLQTYKDTLGVPTIGWGHALKPNESYPNGITQVQADAFLLADLEVAYKDALKLVPSLDNLDDVRKAVIIDMSYNMGLSRFAGFHNFFAAIKDKDFIRAAHEMKNSRWYGQHVNRSQPLYIMMITGEW